MMRCVSYHGGESLAIRPFDWPHRCNYYVVNQVGTPDAKDDDGWIAGTPCPVYVYAQHRAGQRHPQAQFCTAQENGALVGF